MTGRRGVWTVTGEFTRTQPREPGIWGNTVSGPFRPPLPDSCAHSHASAEEQKQRVHCHSSRRASSRMRHSRGAPLAQSAPTDWCSRATAAEERAVLENTLSQHRPVVFAAGSHSEVMRFDIYSKAAHRSRCLTEHTTVPGLIGL